MFPSETDDDTSKFPKTVFEIPPRQKKKIEKKN